MSIEKKVIARLNIEIETKIVRYGNKLGMFKKIKNISGKSKVSDEDLPPLLVTFMLSFSLLEDIFANKDISINTKMGFFEELEMFLKTQSINLQLNKTKKDTIQ